MSPAWTISATCTPARPIHVLVAANVDLVAIAEEMLRDCVSVDQRAVGAAEVLEKRIVENGNDCGMLAADCKVGQTDVVVRAPADGDALLVQGDVERRAV